MHGFLDVLRARPPTLAPYRYIMGCARMVFLISHVHVRNLARQPKTRMYVLQECRQFQCPPRSHRRATALSWELPPACCFSPAIPCFLPPAHASPCFLPLVRCPRPFVFHPRLHVCCLPRPDLHLPSPLLLPLPPPRPPRSPPHPPPTYLCPLPFNTLRCAAAPAFPWRRCPRGWPRPARRGCWRRCARRG